MPEHAETWEWGDARGVWGPVAFGDGSAQGPSVPEIRRAGWAIVQLDMHLRPVRALFGSLAGPVQTVGRAERTAALHAFQSNPILDLYISDLLSLVQEGLSWDPELARGMKKYAGIWRSIFAQVAQHRSSSEPPVFVWTPTHLTAEEALERGCDLVAWVGNAWADYFAKLASSRAMIANVTKEALEGEIKYHKATLDYISWAAARMIRTGEWTDTPPPPSAPRMSPSSRLSLHGHNFYVSDSTDEVRCIACFVGARTRSTLLHLCTGPSRFCKPTALSA